MFSIESSTNREPTEEGLGFQRAKQEVLQEMRRRNGPKRWYIWRHKGEGREGRLKLGKQDGIEADGFDHRLPVVRWRYHDAITP